MVTGASTADLAVVLIDARKGVLEQSKRHAFISALLGIPKLVVAVNKMDLVDYSQERFEEVVEEFEAFARILRRDGAEPAISTRSSTSRSRRSTATTSSSPLQGMDWWDDRDPHAARASSSGSRSPTTIPTTGPRASPCSG